MTHYQYGFLKKCAEAGMDPRYVLSRAYAIKRAAEGDNAAQEALKLVGETTKNKGDIMAAGSRIYDSTKSIAKSTRDTAAKIKGHLKGLGREAKITAGVAAGTAAAVIAATKLHKYLKKKRQKRASVSPRDVISAALFRARQLKGK